MSLFDDVRGVPFPEVAVFYGVVINHNNCLCPFHSDSHPSMKVYPDHGYCFSCNTRADNVDLVAKLFGMQPKEAAQRIAHDFGIAEHSVPDAVIRKRREERRVEEQKKEITEEVVDLLIRYGKLLQEWQTKYAPESPDAELDPRFVMALQNLDRVKFVLDEYFAIPHEEFYEEFVSQIIKDGDIQMINQILGGIDNE